MTHYSNLTGLLNAYSLPTAICNKHGQILQTSKTFNHLWPLEHQCSLQSMFFERGRWLNDWRSVVRNKTIELIETRLCDPLGQHMLRTSRVELQQGDEVLWLVELQPRKQFTDAFVKLTSYYSKSQRQKHRSHLMNLQMQKAVKESQTDPLTGIANRRAFDEHLQEVWQFAIKDRHPIVLFSADIDHFKMINDLLGHSRGDEILVQVAQRLDKVLSRNSDVVARVGGEEFAMVLSNTQPDGGKKLAYSAVKAISKLNIPHPASPAADRVTISLGCSSIEPGPRDNISKLINAADQALYFAKRSGRNCSSYMDFRNHNIALISA